ncbi:hypothetical protein JKF63_02932 [Porcisia hertigi]|uniref:Uncharacterized protein n=1 Tax=Porcisia hertigi TaxID=2761500 RepID=A0A836HT57_9TRYP|nr:hypothetical protein JKF63_02932 [Porcisia hertigi]
MPSSFAAQRQGSHNPHQNPLRSHKGGYLRCPFNISTSYAQLAERRVCEDLSRSSGKVAVADMDGLMSSSSAGRHADGDATECDFGGRPWTRAGVGANGLSGKEKRTQQEQAELIYGRGTLGGDEDITTAAGVVSVRSNVTQENMFAVDSRDKSALQRVVPRAVREKIRRCKPEDPKKERFTSGQPHRHGFALLHLNGASDVETVKKKGDRRDSEDPVEAPLAGRVDFSLAAACSSQNTASHVLQSASSKSHASGSDGGAKARAEQSPRLSPAAAPPQRSPLQMATPVDEKIAPSRPKNRMQMLDDVRVSALLGKRRRR